MIVIAYVARMLHPETLRWGATNHTDDDTVLVELPLADPTAYWRLLADQWRVHDDLVVVEQDVVPASGIVEDMLACDQPWCASPYWAVDRWISTGLGCTRFSAGLKAALPTALDDVGRVATPDGAERVWWLLDWRLSRLLQSAGYEPHEHEHSTHLHSY